MTTGEKRVRIDFNVSGDSKIDNLKKVAAGAIDLFEKGDESVFMKGVDFGINGLSEMIYNLSAPEDASKVEEFNRLKALALKSLGKINTLSTMPLENSLDAIELAAMYGVKALTV